MASLLTLREEEEAPVSRRAKPSRIWRLLRPSKERMAAPLSPTPSDARVFPDDPERIRVLLLVSNSVDYDTRVKKTAAALRAGGYAVGILGVGKPNAVFDYDDPGLIRTVYQPVTYNFLFRRELKALSRLSDEKEKRAEALKKVIAARKESQNYLLRHDDLLADLQSKRTLVDCSEQKSPNWGFPVA